MLNFTSNNLFSYFGWDNTALFTLPLVKNHILVDSPFMWNINYQGVLYGDNRIRENMTMIWAQVMTAYRLIYLPQADWDILVEEWSPIGEVKYSKTLS